MAYNLMDLQNDLAFLESFIISAIDMDLRIVWGSSSPHTLSFGHRPPKRRLWPQESPGPKPGPSMWTKKFRLLVGHFTLLFCYVWTVKKGKQKQKRENGFPNNGWKVLTLNSRNVKTSKNGFPKNGWNILTPSSKTSKIWKWVSQNGARPNT